MSFRDIPGHVNDWVDARQESGFSNFQFVDERYSANSILRRIFSLARKSDYQSVLIERIAPSACSLLDEEDVALSLRNPTFKGSTVTRLTFLTSAVDVEPEQSDFIGYAVVKQDDLGHSQRTHVYESVMPPPRH